MREISTCVVCGFLVGFLNAVLGGERGIGRVGWDGIAVVGNSGGVSVSVAEIGEKASGFNRRHISPFPRDLVLGRYFPESYRSPTPLSPEPAPAQKGQARPLIVNAVAPLSMTADRVSSLPIFLFPPSSSCFCSWAGISPNSFHPRSFFITLTPSLSSLTYPFGTPSPRLSRIATHTRTGSCLPKTTSACPLAAVATRIANSKAANLLLMARLLLLVVVLLLLCQARRLPRRICILRFILRMVTTVSFLRGGLAGLGKNGFFGGFLFFADWVICVGFGFVCREV